MEYRYTNWVVRLREDSRPKTLVLELTTACNYSCIHCFRFAARDFKVTFMDKELYHRIVKEAMDIGVGRIVYTGWGEPTVHPRFMEFLEVAKKLGFEVVVNTNGSRLEELAVSFVRLGVDEVYVSIDAFDIKLYSSIRRFGDLSTVTRGLLTLRKVKTEISSLKPTVKAILTVTKVNVGEISRVLDYAVDTGISEVVISGYIPYIGGDLGLDCLGDEDCRMKFREELSKLSLRILESGIKVTKPLLEPTWTRSCPFASNKALYIRADGLVTPCLYYSRSWATVIRGVKRDIGEVVLGDARRDSLLDIWRRYSKILLNLDFNNIPSCFNCELQNYCYNTMSNEYDCLGNTPSCSHCPYLHLLSYCPI